MNVKLKTGIATMATLLAGSGLVRGATQEQFNDVVSAVTVISLTVGLLVVVWVAIKSGIIGK